MSVRASDTPVEIGTEGTAEIGTDLGEGATGFQVANSNHPLNRKVTVGIRATLGELTTNSIKAQWAPGNEQLRGIYQHKKFTSLTGEAEKLGDLKSVVVHKISASNVNSTFPIAVGAKIHGVEEKHYSSVGTPYSMIVMPNQKNQNSTTLQEEDVSVAYDFAKRYPGYSAENLETNGIHAVPQRRFVLVSAGHPLVTAIQENATSLQTSDITQMPEQLIKISSNLYDTLMPLVKQQVSSQIKVLDMTRMSVELSPADFTSWGAVADQLSREAVSPIKSEQRRALKKAAGDATRIAAINAEFAERIEAEQDAVSSTPLEMFLELDTDYNFL